jgi:hypothetical protein
MSPFALLLGARLVGVVDRVEGEIAVVEAADGLFVDLPLTLLPPGTTEGDRVLLSARRPPLFSFSRFSVSQNPSAVSGAALGVSPPAVSLHPQKD